MSQDQPCTPIRLVIISGRSGSGKSVALRAIEDLDFYCIDNLPVSLLPEVIDLAQTHYPRLAVSIDIRNLPANYQSLDSVYRAVRTNDALDTTLIYIDAADEVLLRRYLETRRLHPLSRQQLSLDQAIALERTLLADLASIADLRIDTSQLTVHGLAQRLSALLAGRKGRKLLMVFESFGFKYGIAQDADFVFDSRFLPNPYWIPELRDHSGLEEPVRAFFRRYAEVEGYIGSLEELLTGQLDLLSKSNRSYLTVAIGCTGGYHRSVYIAQSLCDRFRARGMETQVLHRALEAAAH